VIKRPIVRSIDQPSVALSGVTFSSITLGAIVQLAKNYEWAFAEMILSRKRFIFQLRNLIRIEEITRRRKDLCLLIFSPFQISFS